MALSKKSWIAIIAGGGILAYLLKIKLKIKLKTKSEEGNGDERIIQDYPIVTTPVTSQPVTTPPVATPPVATPPVVTTPVTSQPVTTPPVATQPGTPPPVATPPVVTLPSSETSQGPIEPNFHLKKTLSNENLYEEYQYYVTTSLRGENTKIYLSNKVFSINSFYDLTEFESAIRDIARQQYDGDVFARRAKIEFFVRGDAVVNLVNKINYVLNPPPILYGISASGSSAESADPKSSSVTGFGITNIFQHPETSFSKERLDWLKLVGVKDDEFGVASVITDMEE